MAAKGVVGSLVFFNLVLGMAAGDMPPPPDPLAEIRAIEQKVLANRRAIVSGKVELESKFWKVSGEQRTLQEERTTTIWFDGNKIRGDAKSPAYQPNQAEGAKASPVREINCFSGDKLTFWNDAKSSGGGRKLITIWDLKHANMRAHAVIHPRMLGMVPEWSANLVRQDLGALFGRPDREAFSIQNTQLSRLDCRRIDFRFLNGIAVHAWIAPERDFSVVRIETEFERNGKHYRYSVDSNLTKTEETGCWFPNSCHYQRRINGQLVEEEQLIVKAWGLNKPLAPSVFTLAEMGIPVGTKVQRVPEGPDGPVFWDGRDLVPIANLDLSSDSSRPYIYFYCSCGLALLAAVFIFWYFRSGSLTSGARRRAQSSG